jgi:hypothetical protein
MDLKFRGVHYCSALSALFFVLGATSCAAKGASEQEEGGSDATGTTPQDGSGSAGPDGSTDRDGGEGGASPDGASGPDVATGNDSGTTLGDGGTSTAGQCPADAIFCTGFEDGTIPGAAVFYPAYQQATISTYMTVDGTVGNHGSAHSLKVTPGSNFSQMLGVKTGAPTFWTRVYLMTATVDTSAVTGHDTFVAGIDDTANGGTLANSGDPNNGEQVRIGEHECQLELNRNSDDKEILSDAVDGGSNYVCAGGITFSPSTWYCLETLYDGPNSTVRVFVDGSEVSALHVTDWGPYVYDMFKFGFENYSGTPRTIWYDDIAIAPQQVGCFP